MQKQSSDEELKIIDDNLKQLNIADLDFTKQTKQEPNEQEKDSDDFHTKIVNALESIKRPTDVDVFAGILTALSALAMLHPNLGPEVSSKLNLAASFIDKLCGKNDKFESEVDTSIRSALSEFADSALEEEVNGVVRSLRESFVYINTKSETKGSDVPILMEHDKISSHTIFLGKLEKKIEVYNKSNDKIEALRAIRYTDLYVKLVVYRACIMLMLIQTILPVDNSTATRLFEVWKHREQADKVVLKFLTKPEKSMALFFAFWYPSKTPKILMYLKHLKLELSLPNLCELGMSYTFQIVDSKSREQFGMKRRRRFFSSAVMEVIHANGKLQTSCNFDYQFYFESISEVDSIFHIRSMSKPHLYVFMENGWSGQCYACESEPGPQGQWKITYLKNHKYILSTVMWPDLFLFGRTCSYRTITVTPYAIPPNDLLTNCSLIGQKTRPSEFCISGASCSAAGQQIS